MNFCKSCHKPVPTFEDWDRYKPGQGVHLCWVSDDCSDGCEGCEGEDDCCPRAEAEERGYVESYYDEEDDPEDDDEIDPDDEFEDDEDILEVAWDSEPSRDYW